MKGFESIPATPFPKEMPGKKEVSTIGDLSRAVYSDFLRMHAEEIRSGRDVGGELKNALETAINQAQHLRNVPREKFAKYLLDDLETNILLGEELKNEVKSFLKSIINPEIKRDAA